VRSFLRGVLSHLRIPIPEIYPRQDALSGKGLGNLVRFPLWNQSRFVDVTAGWKTLPPIRTLSAVAPVTPKRLRQVADQLEIDLTAPSPTKATKSVPKQAHCDLPERVRLLLEHDDCLAARWRGDTTGLADTSRSAVVFSLACLFVRRFIPTEEIAAALHFWCAQEGYEKGEREDWLKAAIDKAYDLAGEDCLRRRQREGSGLPKDTPALIRRSFNNAVTRKLQNRQRRNA
jgi:hypothetical protein